jgi:hypothetical protein
LRKPHAAIEINRGISIAISELLLKEIDTSGKSPAYIDHRKNNEPAPETWSRAFSCGEISFGIKH